MEQKQKIWMLTIFSFVIVAIFVAGMAIVFSMNRSAMKKFESINAVYIPVKSAFSTVHEHTLHLQAMLKDLVTTGDEDLIEEMSFHRKQVSSSISYIIDTLPGNAGAASLDEAFSNFMNSAIVLAEKFSVMSMAALAKDMNQVNIHREHFDSHVESVERELESDYQQTVASTQSQLQQLAWTVFIMVFVLVTALALGSFLISRRLSQRLSTLTVFAREVQQGRYDKTIEENWNDEFSVLARAFNSMITSIRSSTEKLSRLANYDSLTEVYSRAALISQLEANIQSVRRHKYPLSFCMCDVDKFKHVNDTYGHEMGDRVLEVFASYLKTVLRTEDIIGRYGGDEFSIILPHTSAETAKVALERVKSCLQDHVFKTYGGDSFSVTCSFGVAEFHHEMDKTLLMRAADEALYLSKQGGRNCISIK